MDEFREITAQEIRRAKALRVAMEIRGRKTIEFAKELGIKPPSLSRWRSTGRFNYRNFDIILKRLGYSEMDFLALGE